VEKGLSPTQKQEQIFRSELIKHGIKLEQAIPVARVLALNIPDEDLTSSEAALVASVCKQWIERRSDGSHSSKS
jgi:hypothetical protein